METLNFATITWLCIAEPFSSVHRRHNAPLEFLLLRIQTKNYAKLYVKITNYLISLN